MNKTQSPLIGEAEKKDCSIQRRIKMTERVDLSHAALLCSYIYFF